MGRLKKIMKQVENVMAAVSFAEEGSLDEARSLLTEGRRVLLGVKEGHLDPKTLKYALNTARRISARLDILYVAPAGSRPSDYALAVFQSQLKSEGIPYRVIERTGCLKQQIIDYTNQEKDIAFAVVESSRTLEAGCRSDKTLSELWQKLKCPLVVVMEGAKA